MSSFESVGGEPSPMQAAIHDHVREVLAVEHARLERDLGRALSLQAPHRWRRIHIVAEVGITDSVGDLVGWVASWRSAAVQAAVMAQDLGLLR